ncbi:hypothetical protein QAD02_010915 [Eretmocerus hayati]|uniref:Uncharacterized protein n=1 Tax=Eretmocerus hayati TaxID=131215 RepID=A0ACC2NV48_9HYME|nr:hypothetical protein QAD02_010915 [Eretmocerus hayati]
MNLSIIYFFAVMELAVMCKISEQDSSIMIDFVDFMEKHYSTYQVTVITKSTEKLGSFSSGIVKLMIDEFSSVVMDDKVKKPKFSENLWRKMSHQSKLKIGIVELHQESHPLEELSNLLDFLKLYSENVREKSIIFLIDGNGQSLQQFFKLAWSKDFFDITVIEWITQQSKKTFRPEDFVCHEIFIHTFDPFKDKYTKEILSQNTDVLP